MTTVAVLFDVDKTLIVSGGAGTEAWRRAFRELHGVEVDIGRFAEDGVTDPEAGRLAFAGTLGREPSGRELAQLLHRRQEHLPEAVAASVGYRVLPGVRETLSALSREGVLLGLTTGGTQGSAHIKLERGHLNRYFSFGGYGSDSPDRVELTRTAVARAATVLGESFEGGAVMAVGDTPLDIGAAHGAGIRGVGVATGHYDEAALRGAGADAVLSDLTHPLPL